MKEIRHHSIFLQNDQINHVYLKSGTGFFETLLKQAIKEAVAKYGGKPEDWRLSISNSYTTEYTDKSANTALLILSITVILSAIISLIS